MSGMISAEEVLFQGLQGFAGRIGNVGPPGPSGPPGQAVSVDLEFIFFFLWKLDVK